MLRDLRLAVRAFRRDPGVFAVAAVSLALGIAALTTVWAAVDVLILRPYPYDPDGSLVLVGTGVGGRGNPGSPTSIPDFEELRGRARSMDVAAYADAGANLGADPATWVSVRRASADFFDVVGVPPLLGRAFTAADERPGAPDVALLSHGLWQRRFGSDRAVLGRSVPVDGAAVTIVGVLPAGFRFNRGAPDIWLPLHLTGAASRAARSVFVFGRLRGGELAAARGELASIGRTLRETYPESWAERAFVAGRLRETLTGSATLQQGVGAILLASLAVLLIACANVANLLLVRAAVRGGDLVLRRALGASRWRLARQLLAEALVLATVAGLVGLGLSVVGMRGFASLLPPELPRAGEIALDARAAGIAMAAAWASVLVFVLAPALRTLGMGSARHARPADARGATDRGAGRGRLRAALVAGEVALALVLVAMTMLVARSLTAIHGLDTGFETEHVLAFDLSLPESRYPDEAALAGALERLDDALASTPGVDAGGVGVGLPGRSWRVSRYRLPGQPSEAEDADVATVATRFADPDYLATLGVEAVRGRGLEAGDDAHSAPVALVNRLFAERLWPGDDPIGRTLVVDGRTVEIVGLAPDLLEMGPFGSPGVLYLPLAQWPSRSLSVVLRAPTRTAGARALAGEVVARVDPTLAPHGVAAMEDVLVLAADKTVALGKVLGVLSVVALVLSLVGVFGSMAYTVARRVPEIGVRMALGASPGRIRAMVLRRASAVCAVGLVVGSVLAVVAARGVTAFLFGVRAGDPGTYVAAGGLLLVAGLAAAWIPARRGSAVDPVRSLRAD